MSWFVYEMSKRPDLQKRLQLEVDTFFQAVKGRTMEYRDCRKLPFLTRCITETLRLWPVVPWGSFRELQFDDFVTGANGKAVKVPKGAYFQVPSWNRHRDPVLWGDDVHVFNPDRSYADDELWHDESFMAYNPSSKRYSPFTYPPRDCLGKNFAQMEMRMILSQLFRDFTFALAEPTRSEPAESYLGNASGFTLGPTDTLRPPDIRPDGSKRPKLGCYVHAIPRIGREKYIA